MQKRSINAPDVHVPNTGYVAHYTGMPVTGVAPSRIRRSPAP